MPSTDEVAAAIGIDLPAGWHIEAHERPERWAIRVILWRDVDAQIADRSRDGVALTLGDLIHDALFGTFQRWLGAQPLADRYWAE
jgi:hypothetical protein